VPKEAALIIINLWRGIDGWGGVPTADTPDTFLYLKSVSFTPGD
jgi:hypothetical protein